MRESRWIPVTERLPERAGNYICTVVWEDGTKGTYGVWYHARIRTDIEWDLDGMPANVTAWMPWPEPYEER